MPGSEYGVHAYGRMLRDARRVDVYTRALRGAVKSTSVVIDIGTGVGYFAVLASKYGASRVYGIEPDESIYLARGIVEDNNCDSSVTLIKGRSEDLNLTEMADVIVSDLRGVLPLYQRHIPVIVDARSRLLKSTGTLIPARDHLYAALVTNAGIYASFHSPWDENSEVDMQSIRAFSVNSWSRVNLDPLDMISMPVRWATLDYSEITSPDVSGEADWLINEPGTAHGVLLWFDAQLTEDIEYSNAPTAPLSVYGQAFFPFEEPLKLQADDKVHVQLAAVLHDGDYAWSWETVHNHGLESIRFHQSTSRGVYAPWPTS